jgi:hypothetical protein
MPYISDWFVHRVESSGTELLITVVLDGLVIVGYLTPVKRFEDWRNTGVGSRRDVTGRSIDVREPPKPLEIWEAEEIRERWKETGTPTTFEYFAMHTVQIRGSSDESWIEHPYIIVAASKVAAMSLADARVVEV